MDNKVQDTGGCLEINITKEFTSVINKLLSLQSEYVDILANGYECSLSVNINNFIYAGFCKVVNPVSDLNIRIPSQVLRQMKTNCNKVRIFTSDTEVKIFLFAKDISQKPIKIVVRNSISYLAYYDVISKCRESTEFGLNSTLPKCIPALREILKVIPGFTNKNLLIEKGIVFVESTVGKNQLLNLFVNLGISKLNIVIPSIILKYMLKIVDETNSSHGLIDGYNVLKTDDFIYCWRAVRTIPVSDYAYLQKMNYSVRKLVNFSKLYELISNLKIAENRDQMCQIQLNSQSAIISENDILTYEVPVPMKNYSQEVIESLETSVVKVRLAELLNLIKGVYTEDLDFRVYSKFIEIFKIVPVKDFGTITISLLLKQTGVY